MKRGKPANNCGRKKGKVDVMVIGDVLMDYQFWVDTMPNPGEDREIMMSSISPGGSAANTAIALSAFKIPCAFCGKIGVDEPGQEIVKQMKSVGLDISCLQYGKKTGYTVTIVDGDSERTMLSYRGVSSEPMKFTSELSGFLSHAKLLLLSGYSLVNKLQAKFSIEAAKQIKKAGGYVAIDASPNIGLIDQDILSEIFQMVDIILPNKQELETLTNTQDISHGIELLLKQIPCIALKLGAEGSMLALRKGFQLPNGRKVPMDKIMTVPAKKVEAIDTTGAGDSFNAGFVAAFLRDENPEKWLESGNNLAATIITRKGATSAFMDI